MNAEFLFQKKRSITHPKTEYKGGGDTERWVVVSKSDEDTTSSDQTKTISNLLMFFVGV
jgi:hypothetical protein